MFYHEGDQLQYTVRVERPDPVFARYIQQAVGGVEGEIRVAMQYLSQALAMPETEELKPYRRALLDTAAEEFGHIEMLMTAIRKNLQGAPTKLRKEGRDKKGTESIGMGEMLPRQYLSAGLNPLLEDSNGVPFNGNYVIASGNPAADMYANIAAESSGRLLATRLYHMTDDPGMKDMFAYLIARDTMHQNQWLQILKDLADPKDPWDVLPIPDSFPDEAENQEFNYAFMSTNINKGPNPEEPWTHGCSPDDEGVFSYIHQQDLRGYDPKTPPTDSGTFNDPRPRDEDMLACNDEQE